MGYILAEGETQAAEMVSESRVSGPASPAFTPKDRARFGEASPELVAGGDAATSASEPLPDGWIKTTPLARRIAREHGIDLSSVRPSGPGGRIVEADVRAMLSSPPRPVSKSASPENAALPAVRSRAKLTPMRLAIGERLKRAQSNAASLTLTREVSADLLAAARTRARRAGPGCRSTRCSSSSWRLHCMATPSTEPSTTGTTPSCCSRMCTSAWQWQSPKACWRRS